MVQGCEPWDFNDNIERNKATTMAQMKIKVHVVARLQQFNLG
jgi:hypothetical protein